jgi:hypothetical protein
MVGARDRRVISTDGRVTMEKRRVTATSTEGPELLAGRRAAATPA